MRVIAPGAAGVPVTADDRHPRVTNAWLLLTHDKIGRRIRGLWPDGVIRTSSGPCSSCYRVWRERAALRLAQ